MTQGTGAQGAGGGGGYAFGSYILKARIQYGTLFCVCSLSICFLVVSSPRLASPSSGCVLRASADIFFHCVLAKGTM